MNSPPVFIDLSLDEQVGKIIFVNNSDLLRKIIHFFNFGEKVWLCIFLLRVINVNSILRYKNCENFSKNLVPKFLQRNLIKA